MLNGLAAQLFTHGGVRTVEGVVQDALDRVLGAQTKLSVAGRTDAGVHAEGQVVSFTAPEDVEPERIKRALNGMLAPEVVVRSARSAPDGFDARHSARARLYRYRINTGPVPDPFTARYVWHRPGSLRLGAMRSAARHLIGEHDFASFCRTPQRGGTVRHLLRLSLSAQRNEVHVTAEANGFLHQMVRSLTGTLAAVGEGRIDPDSLPSILAARSRSAAGAGGPPP